MTMKATRSRVLAMLFLLLALLLGGLGPWDKGGGEGTTVAEPTPTATPIE